VDPRRIIPVGRGEREARKVWLKDGTYYVDYPGDDVVSDYTEITLKESYINKFRRSDKKTFELLHQLNRRTEGDVMQMDFDPSTAPPANKKYLQFLRYP
jgi:peptidoglycan-associated lipoprotein